MKFNTTNKEFNRFKKLRIKLELIREDIDFLKKCKSKKVFPNFIQHKFSCKTDDKRVKKLIYEAKRKLLDVEVNRHYMRAERIRREAYSLHLFLLQNTHQSIWTEREKNVNRTGNFKSIRKRRTHRKKLHQLITEQIVCKQSEKKDPVNFVINKTERTFTTDQLRLLNKGLKYKPKPLEVPKNEIIVAVESTIQFMQIEEKMNIREEVSKILTERNDEDIGSKKEFRIIKELKKSGCVFLEPDKGKAVVIMEREDYRKAAMDHLSSNNYKLVKSRRKFPVDQLQAEVKAELKKLKDEGFLSGLEVRKLTIANPVIPSFSCLPKTHKEGNKIRPVVSNINSPTSEICKMLVQRIRSLKKPFSLSVKNSFEMANILVGKKLEDNEILISFDVEALYPSVPVNEAVKLFVDWIDNQDIADIDAQIIVRMLKLVMKQRWLEFEGKIYEQKDGLFIGNALSPILAEIFMGSIEKKAMNNDLFPRFWYRYVDDVVAIVRKGEEHRVLDFLNSQNKAIRFTMEVESSGMLPFLDLKIIREGDGLALDIYRKPTDAPLCITRDSHHPWKYKTAAFESALFRMWNIPLSECRRKVELEYLKEMARVNGYDERLVRKLNNKHEMRWERKKYTKLKPALKMTSNTDTSKSKVRGIVLPYHSALTNRLSNKLRANGVNTVYGSRGTLKELIGKVKRSRPKMECSGIYNIKCNDCAGNYVGQTRRRIETREKEHDRAINLRQPEKSALAFHSLEEQHRKGECKLLKKVENIFQLDAWESLYIAKGQNLVNTGEPPLRSKLFELASI